VCEGGVGQLAAHAQGNAMKLSAGSTELLRGICGQVQVRSERCRFQILNDLCPRSRKRPEHTCAHARRSVG
jgi:hypothetical protein